MESLFDELERKLALDPSMLKRGGPRVDLSLLLFNARAEVRALWLAAAAEVEATATPTPALAAAVAALRPIFGPRAPAAPADADSRRRPRGR
ncbi:MAG: hypothetical protein JNK64_16170 [Myxococcales bacterium]|nr:hypothetical protein [Myxococcales bacterium]